jgi:hypothetical protein
MSFKTEYIFALFRVMLIMYTLCFNTKQHDILFSKYTVTYVCFSEQNKKKFVKFPFDECKAENQTLHTMYIYIPVWWL